MKKTIFFLCFSISFIFHGKANTPTLPAGTAVFVALSNKTFAKDIKFGDQIEFYVTKAISIDNQIVVANRARALGRVTGVTTANPDFPAHVFIEIHSIETIDGTNINVSGGKMYFMENPSSASVLTRVQGLSADLQKYKGKKKKSRKKSTK